MNWYNVFYWVTRADSIKKFFDTASNIFTWFAVLLFITHIILSAFSKHEEEMSDKISRAYSRVRRYFATLFYVNLAVCLITWFGYVITPTKKETLLIIAGGGTMQFLTTDSAAKQLPSELSNFVVTELRSMAKEAKVDLGLSTQKDKILDQAKQMTSEQVLEKMRLDTNFAKIVLGN